MSASVQLTDKLLGEALAKRAGGPPSPMLLDRIVAAAASTPQERPALPWWRRGAGAQPRSIARQRWFWPAFASVIATVLVVAVTLSVLRPIVAPGESPSPPPTPTAPAASPFAPSATSETVFIGDATARRLALGPGIVGPIDVIEAFGSIWVANIVSGDVRRYDPDTLAELARIDAPGAAWFAVANGAVWVTDQTGSGLNRIDPSTNTVVVTVGQPPPCGAPVLFGERIWQSACDGDVFLEIDPADNTVREIPAQGHGFLVAAGGELITSAPDGLARLDPATGSFTLIPGTEDPGGQLLGSDGDTVWKLVGGQLVRIDPVDGRRIAEFDYVDARAVTFADGSAWVAVGLVGVVEIDLASNTVVRTIPMREAGLARATADAIWVTDFENHRLWRIQR